MNNFHKDHKEIVKSVLENRESHRRKIFHSIKAKANAKRTLMEKMADFMTAKFGGSGFLIFNVILFFFWILINTDKIPSIPAFDPFPFNLLTTVVSLEAIVLAIFVLISQNRTSKVDDLREEIHLQLNIISEKEVTKLIKMVSILLEKQGVDLSQDAELKKMIHNVDESKLEKEIEKEIF